MAASTTPVYTNVPTTFPHVRISAANTNRDGTGTLGTVVSAGTNGSRVEGVQIKASGAGSTTAGMIRFFVFDGTNTYLIGEVLVSAITPSGTVASFDAVWTPFRPLVLPSGCSLKASTNNAEQFDLHAFGGDY